MRKFIFFFLLGGALYAFNLDINDPRYLLLEELRVRGIVVPDFPLSKPYCDEDLLQVKGLKEISNPFTYNLYRLHLSSFVERRLNSAANIWFNPVGDTVTVFYFGFGGGTYLSKNIEFYVSTMFHFGDDSIYPWGKWIEIISGEYERGYFKYTKKGFTVLVGRERFAFGPSPRRNLLFSGYAFPQDVIYLSFEKGPIKYMLYNTRLDNWVADHDIDYLGGKYHVKQGDIIKRYFSMHRIELNLFNRFFFAATDAIVYGGPDRSWEWYYMNPFFLNWPYQLQRGTDDNPIVNIECKLYFPNSAIYGEFMIDDLQTSHKPAHEPNEVGILAGVEVTDPFGFDRTFFLAEYVRTYRWTYNQFLPWNKPLFLKMPLGHPLGSDFDQFYVMGLYHLDFNTSVKTFLEFTRDGEGSIDEPWPPFVFPEENFLVGTVEKRLNIGLGLSTLLPEGYFNCEICWAKIENRHHIEGNNQSFVSFQMKFGANASSARLRDLWRILKKFTGW